MFQKYSVLCLLTSCPVRQETMQVEEGEGDVLDKAIFNKVNICYKSKWIIEEKNTKQPKILMKIHSCLKKKKSAILRLETVKCFCDFQKECQDFGKEIYRLAYGLKIYGKSIA